MCGGGEATWGLRRRRGTVGLSWPLLSTQAAHSSPGVTIPGVSGQLGAMALAGPGLCVALCGRCPPRLHQQMPSRGQQSLRDRETVAASGGRGVAEPGPWDGQAPWTPGATVDRQPGQRCEGVLLLVTSLFPWSSSGSLAQGRRGDSTGPCAWQSGHWPAWGSAETVLVWGWVREGGLRAPGGEQGHRDPTQPCSALASRRVACPVPAFPSPTAGHPAVSRQGVDQGAPGRRGVQWTDQVRAPQG